MKRSTGVSKELFEAVIENMHDALAVYNSKGNIILLNAEARRLYPHLDAHTSASNAHNRFNILILKKILYPEKNSPQIEHL